jgi:hypothetical protein
MDIDVVVVGHHSACTDIGMLVYDCGIRANIGFLRRDGEPRGSKRRCDTMLDFA